LVGGVLVGIPGIDRILEIFKMCTHTELLVMAVSETPPKFLNFCKKGSYDDDYGTERDRNED
jgi:hypothetical protein